MKDFSIPSAQPRHALASGMAPFRRVPEARAGKWGCFLPQQAQLPHQQPWQPVHHTLWALVGPATLTIWPALILGKPGLTQDPAPEEVCQALCLPVT